MTTFKILVNGYARKTSDGWLATPNTILIEDSGKKILVDPGMNKELLEKGMANAGISKSDIDLIFVTHRHSDHILNIRMFPETDYCDPTELIRGQKIILYSDKIPGTSIQVIKTPGHLEDHASLMIDTDKGKVCIAGDLFWWTDDQEQKTDRESLINLKDLSGNDEKTQIESRKKILDLADWIIPGHGKMFKVIK
jgi:glyoxylase-like metal-dependent hydrolase (beta-lactamase superfamily II)